MWRIKSSFSVGDHVSVKKAGFVYDSEWSQAMETFHPMALRAHSTYDFDFHGVVENIGSPYDPVPETMIVNIVGAGVKARVYCNQATKV
ncbi:MAG: hypothetical protein MJZ20_07035 [Bacteroidaceae bacterium]|nr:hypothetical protein [Bacteroidaceae bacterium]